MVTPKLFIILCVIVPVLAEPTVEPGMSSVATPEATKETVVETTTMDLGNIEEDQVSKCLSGRTAWIDDPETKFCEMYRGLRPCLEKAKVDEKEIVEAIEQVRKQHPKVEKCEQTEATTAVLDTVQQAELQKCLLDRINLTNDPETIACEMYRGLRPCLEKAKVDEKEIVKAIEDQQKKFPKLIEKCELTSKSPVSTPQVTAEPAKETAKEATTSGLDVFQIAAVKTCLEDRSSWTDDAETKLCELYRELRPCLEKAKVEEKKIVEIIEDVRKADSKFKEKCDCATIALNIAIGFTSLAAIVLQKMGALRHF